jgi:hypothetical protein
MGRVSQGAGHRGAKPPGGAKRDGTKTVRVQLHLGETTSKRLSVHAALVGRNASRVADEVLASWLARFGRGREIFDAPEGAVESDPVETEDRPRARAGINPDDQDAA